MHNEDKITINAVKKVSPAVVSIVISKMMPKIKESPVCSPDTGFGPFCFILPEDNKNNKENNPKGSGLLDPSNNNSAEKVRVGGGSGFIIRSEGIVLTNKHVVFDPDAEYIVITSDEKEYPAKVLTRDQINDIAILKIEPSGNKFPTVNLGSSLNIEAGQTVVAIGNALGLFSNSVSKGIVSGLSRQISASLGSGEGQEQLRGVIQTDVAINQGNSGGPLINLEGHVVGINTAVIFGAQNIGFAIPIDKAKKDIEDLEKYGRIMQPFIGLRYVNLNNLFKDKYNLPVSHGALVLKDYVPGSHAVVPNSPADKAGIRENDIITEINGKKVDEKNDLSDVIQNHKIGEKITLTVLRRNKQLKVDTLLEERK